MVDEWTEEPAGRGLTRRRTLQLLGLAGAGAVVASLLATSKSLLPPPITCTGAITDRFLYGRPNPGQTVWWKALVNRPARATDFALWDGAATVWRPALDANGLPEPGCGLPAIVIRVDGSLLEYPTGPPFPFGDSIIDTTINGEQYTFVALYDRCVHLCCNPGWHLANVPRAFRTYDLPGIGEPRTFLANPSQDPVWCLCHNSQYDPVTLVNDRHPNGVQYVGAQRVHGPANRGLPAIPLKLNGEFIEGIYEPADGGHPQWYSAYCR